MLPRHIKIKHINKPMRLFGGNNDTIGMKSGYVVLKPQESVGRHITESKEEAIIILEGKAQINADNSTPIVAEAGSVVYIPAQTSHDVRNTGRGVLRYIYVVSNVPK